MYNIVQDGEISVDHVWRSLKEKYPDEFYPKTASIVEDIRENWITFDNLNECFMHNKDPLIKTQVCFQTKK